MYDMDIIITRYINVNPFFFAKSYDLFGFSKNVYKTDSCLLEIIDLHVKNLRICHTHIFYAELFVTLQTIPTRLSTVCLLVHRRANSSELL